jgi:hypothetical protein
VSGSPRSPGSRERLERALAETASSSIAAALDYGGKSGRAGGMSGVATLGGGGGGGGSLAAADGSSSSGAPPPEDLVRRLVSELDRRTDALRQCGQEIVELRRSLRLARDTVVKTQTEAEDMDAARRAHDDALLMATLRDLGPGLLLAPPNSPGFAVSSASYLFLPGSFGALAASCLRIVES